MKMSLQDIVKVTRGKMNHPEMLQLSSITGVSTDTRSMKKGELFVALHGERHDGHDHIPQAFEKGAVACVVEKLKGDGPQIVVKDSLKSLGMIAQFWRDQFKIPVVAITGSNGKTTTKDMVNAVLSEKFNTLKTEGNFNNWIGLPQTVFGLNQKIQMAILEMGMNHKGEIDWLAQIASPQVGVITNIGRAHIENFKNQSGIARAKGELLKYLPKNGYAIINADSPYFENLKKMTKARVMGFGFSKKSKAQILKVDSTQLGKTGFQIRLESKSFNFEIPLGGAHNVYNAAAAILVGRTQGVSIEKIRKALKNYKPEKKRMEILHLGQGIDVLNDSYNANPDSMKAAISYLHGFAGRHRVVVMGDMFELGQKSKKLHYEVGQAVGESAIEKLIAVGQYATDLVNGATEAGMDSVQAHSFSCIEEVLPHLDNYIRSGDLVLIKGSRGMKMERLTEALVQGRSH